MLQTVFAIKDLFTQITYFISKEEDILSLSLTSKTLFTLFNKEYENQYQKTYPEVPSLVEKSSQSWIFKYLIRSRDNWTFNPSNVIGAFLLCENTLSYAFNLREEKYGPYKDFFGNNLSDIVDEKESELKKMENISYGPSGWRTAYGTRVLKEMGKSGGMVGRHYWEVGVVWVNPSYGDFIIGIAEIKKTEQSGISWGLYYNANSTLLNFFSKWKSIDNFGGAGPGGVQLKKGNINLPVIVSVLFDSENCFLDYYVNGEHVCSYDNLDFFNQNYETSFLVPFCTLYSGGAILQLLTKWVYPDIGHSWLLKKMVN